jgi:LacI family transcriptional regulator
VQDVVRRQVDGIVMDAFSSSNELAPSALDAGVPIVSIGAGIDDPRVDMVRSDDEAGARAATRRLIELGHERIGFLGGDTGPTNRCDGFRRALAEAGLDAVAAPVVEGEWSRAGGAKGLERLMHAGVPPTGVFCANDLIAIGAMDAARALGLRLPGDLSLVGFDDIEAAALITPALTTVLNPAYELGRAAGRLLLDRVTGGHAGPRRIETLPCPLIERASTIARS